MEGQQNESLVQRQNCCCLTGHRSLPSDPDQLAELRQNLRRLICDLAQQGITTFYTGGALGFDTMAAMMVLELKSRLPQLRLHLALPYPEQAKRWSRTDRLLYEQIKEHADRVYLVSMEYSAVCMKKRNYGGPQQSMRLLYGQRYPQRDSADGKLRPQSRLQAV